MVGGSSLVVGLSRFLLPERIAKQIPNPFWGTSCIQLGILPDMGGTLVADEPNDV